MEFVISIVVLGVFGTILLMKAEKRYNSVVDELIAARGEAAKWKSTASA